MSPTTPTLVPAELVELLDDAALTLHELAQGCSVTPEWVHVHVEAGVLIPARGSQATEWRFAIATLTRAPRIAGLQYTYDADPQLAARATALMEEEAQLRRQLVLLGG